MSKQADSFEVSEKMAELTAATEVRGEDKRTPIFPIALGAPRVSARVIPELTCGQRVRVEALLHEATGADYLDKEVTVCGWAKTCRKQGGGRSFIELNDGSCVRNLQVVVDRGCLSEEVGAQVAKAGVAYSFRIRGRLVRSPKDEQTYEMQVCDSEKHSVRVLGGADQAKYPLAKKNHSKEYLREIQHLRPRSYMMGCVMRVRSALAMAIHEFFQSRGYVYVHTPIITGADCEGAGEMFQVTTMMPESGLIKDIPATKDGKIDYKKDFFGKLANLTVSGQLNLENFACSLGDTYTFGPTFRAENSHTSRHLAEFWMIEPEMAFAELEDIMECSEAFLRFCVQYILDRHAGDIAWLEKNVEEGLSARLKNVAESHFARCSYTEAIELLKQQPEGKFGDDRIFWGMDMGSVHERFLSEEHFKKPVIVYNYPYELKAFYMKVNTDVGVAPGATVRAMDVLVPAIGEVIGGSQREENLELLDKQIADKGLPQDNYWWYRELRSYGTVPHAGFGLGFERLVMMVTGVENIRDVIPFPRYPGNCEF
ncbi:asparaginyl-tRNA synthetase [Gregarina niphandrodes]|uniref:asparagine--tRNA ligase n=1 Tax=Gregarina niphandrodes TaxID=110365 RepID=A0A023B6Z4_GRENI|nr:asparaginyl-tRNA synthetase [Gregarina niphandrodes]EZG66852.1 asparaginyl-tRNA synthetase [Gregarina niphandrodes]|eukprot:XP_011130456.1 asparaginyl-tRNA synthetase [Gregarina niphandrodes]